MITRQRVWLKHWRHEEWERCPLCNGRLKWVYDSINWIPCDFIPLLFKWELGGKYSVVKHREIIDGCTIYKGGNADGFEFGLLPHVYSCDGLNGWHGVKYET